MPGENRARGVVNDTARNAEYICRKFAPPVTHAMIVFGHDIAGHDAVVFDRSLREYRQIDTLEILGRSSEIRDTGAATAVASDPQFSRQTLVAGWKQDQLARLKIALVGVGGNGAPVFQTLIAMGTE